MHSKQPGTGEECPLEANPVEANTVLCGCQILVVDDEPALRAYASAVLDELGYACALAENGRAAVQFVLQEPERVAAVLLDMTMPGMTPEETVRLLREIRADLPVVILSGEPESSVRARFGPNVLSGYIQKPYTEMELEAVLRLVVIARAPHPSSDWSEPFSLVRLSGEDLVALRAKYLAQCRIQLAEMERLVARAGFEALRVRGHSLKGSGGCFEYPELTTIGRALETQAGSADAGACRELISSFRNILDRLSPPTSLGASRLPNTE
jgi:CheY-like chemotaxis protein